MDWLDIGFWLLLYAGIPCVMAMHLHRKETKMNRMAVPATILVLAGIAGTADAIGVNGGNGPFEVAESLLYLSIPTMIYLVGACLAIFGGPTPVGPIPKSWRRGGGILMLGSISLIIVQSLGPEKLPIQPAIMNEYAISSLLVGISLIGAVGTVAILSMGEKRWIAAITTSALSIGSIVLLLILTSDSNSIDSGIFSNAIDSALTTAIGTVIGVCFGLWVAFHLAVLVERGATLPETASQVTEKEMELVKKHLKANIGGEQE